MSYINYLKNFDFDILYKTSFLLPFVGIIVVLKILSVLLFSFVKSEDDENKVTLFSNIFFYLIISFSILTIYDNEDRKGIQNFRFSNLGKLDVDEDSFVESEVEENNNLENNLSTEITPDKTSYTPTEEELLRLEKDPEYLQTFEQLVNDLNNIKDLSEVTSFEVCGHEDGKCKWCGNIFSQEKLLKPTYVAMGEVAGLRMTIMESGWNTPEIYKYIKDYQKGIKFQCITEEKEFCSLKCEKEFKNNKGY